MKDLWAPNWNVVKIHSDCEIRSQFCTCYKSLAVWTWWRHQMETFSALLALSAGNSPVLGEFPAQRPVTRTFDVFFDLHPNKWQSKQWWGWRFETPSCPLWRHRNAMCEMVTGLNHKSSRKINLYSHKVSILSSQTICEMDSRYYQYKIYWAANHYALLDEWVNY